MAFEDTYSTRVKSLVNNPADGVKKIIPFIKSRVSPYGRAILEFFHIFLLVKPYSNHEVLLQFVNFKKGFFVQAGGNDGYSNDPTYHLEKVLGWTGIIAEPLPIHRLCKKNRPSSVIYNCAVGSFDNPSRTASFVDCNAMSFVAGSINNDKEWIEAGERTQKIKSKIVSVPIKPIQELIDDYFKSNKLRNIDLLVADTEGYEFEVVKGLDFAKNSPRYILLEIHKNSELKLIREFLSGKGYDMVKEMDQRDFLFELQK